MTLLHASTSRCRGRVRQPRRHHDGAVTPRVARPFAAAAALAAGALLLAPRVALAHVFGGNGGPGAGFMHPLTGPDHLLAMYTVGLLSAAIGGRAIWTVPSAFVLAMVGGGLLGILHLPLPGAEWGVVLSVVMLGAALALRPVVPVSWALVVAAAFGMFHGYAHGTEMPLASSPVLYVAGFIAATAGLHLIGAVSGLLIQCRAGAAGRLRAFGVAIAGAGLILVVRLA